MVFTAAQTNAFFTEATQMAMDAAVVAALAQEGITGVADLEEFKSEQIEQIVKNLRSLQNPLTLGAKSKNRLIVACEMVRYYGAVNRNLTAANMQWQGPLRNFEQQWKAMKDKKDEDDPETPKLTKNLSPMKWSEAFEDVMHRCIGVRMVPLAYVIRENDAGFPVDAPPIDGAKPHAGDFESIEDELIARA